MGAVRMLARSEVRRRARSTVALSLLVGVVGVVVLATAAGARRSESALPRFNAYSRSSSLEISVGTPTGAKLDAFRRTPGVEGVAVLRGYALSVGNNQDLPIAAPVDAAMGDIVDRSRLIAGRRADPSNPEELTIGEALAAQQHIGLGSVLDAASFTPQQIAAAFRGANPGAPAGPHIRLRVVGIDRRPLDLSDRAASGGLVLLTPAFNTRYQHRVGFFTEVVRVRTVRGAADAPRVLSSARRLFGHAQTFQAQSLAVETEGAHDAIHVLTLSLWIFVAAAGLAGLVAIGIILTRDVGQRAGNQSTMRALGLTRRQAVLATGARAAIVAVAAAVIAGLGAFAASPLFPLGLARRADPDVGFHADWLVLALGALIIALAVLAVAVLAAWRAARAAPLDRVVRESGRTSGIVERAARAGLRPTATSGLRFALEPGRGESAVPVRSAFAGAVFGIAGITAVIVFAASLSHLVATPRLSGWAWDLKTEVGTAAGVRCVDSRDYGLASISGIRAVTAVCDPSIEVDGRPLTGWGFQRLSGSVIDPELVAGRAPRAVDEVALGTLTLRALHKHIGDSVRARGDNGTHTYRVVGRIVLPTLGVDPQPMADGAAFTAAGLSPILSAGANESHYLLARFAPDAERAAVVRQVNVLTRRNAVNKDLSNTSGPITPVEVNRLEQISWFPTILGALFVLLAVLAVGHAIVTAVRRRRRELAVFKTVGFVRRQVAATVAWQASTLAVVGLVAGVPIGLLAGRAVWRLVADGLGVSAVAVFPLPALLVTVAGALVLVNLIAFVPARAAARTHPAVALRSE